NAALLLLALAMAAFWFLWKLLTLPFGLWRRRRERIARARLGEGLDALHQGHYLRAEHLLGQAAQDAQFEVAARVAAARAASARGDTADAAGHLDALPAHHALSRAIAIAETALAEGRIADANAVLDAVPATQTPPRLQSLRADAMAASGRSAQALGMLPALRLQQALAPTALAERERAWAERAMRDAADADALEDAWQTLPGALRSEPVIVGAYADRAAALRWEEAATGGIETALESRWDDGLAAQYGALPVGRLEQRRSRAEGWLRDHPASPGALLGLARILRAQGLWPQAEPLLHRAVAQGGGAAAWEELGHGFAAAGDDSRARHCYANALCVARDEASTPLPGRDLREKILAEAAVEDRDAHGLPRLRG
ncbi:MAG: heme biosynthesis protein HemY, partial [Lysobacteraceae bacterium]